MTAGYLPPALVFTAPVTPTGEKPSKADEIAQFAETVLGVRLSPWQRTFIDAVAEGRQPIDFDLARIARRR